MSRRPAPRHAKPKQRRGLALLLALAVLVAVAGAALGQRSRWWASAESGPAPTSASGPTATPTPRTAPAPTTSSSNPPGPRQVRALDGANVAGEGDWTPVVGRLGAPAVEVTWLRLTTQAQPRVGIAWLDQRGLRFELRPGTTSPGVPPGLDISPWLPPREQAGLAAAFNGGFRMADSFGGFYLDGRTIRPLLAGAASAVIYRDGHLDVGAWGRDVRMTPDVVSVRQELVPLIDNGVPGPNLTSRVVLQWGGIVGKSIHVWRSAIGVTASGALVYVCGPGMAPDQLVRVLQRAGAVRAMELDINPYWVTFVWFAHPTSGGAGPVKLAPFPRPADRYTAGPSARDFFAVYLR